mgnify:CR=1 FL=1
MLINARSAEELRIAVVSDAGLENYQVEVGEGGLTRGNIYRGVISNLQSALNAAFVDYGTGKNGFLAIQDVVAEARYAEPTNSSVVRAMIVAQIPSRPMRIVESCSTMRWADFLR